MSARLHVTTEGEDVIFIRIFRIWDSLLYCKMCFYCSINKQSPNLFIFSKYLVPPRRESLIQSFNITFFEHLKIGLCKLQRSSTKLLYNFGHSSSSFLLLRPRSSPEQCALVLRFDHVYAWDTGAQNRSHQKRKMTKRITFQ